MRVPLAILLVVGAMLASVSISAAAPLAPSANSSFAANAAVANDLQLAIQIPIRIPPRLTVVPDCHFLTRTACESLLVAHGLRLGTVSYLLPQGPGPFIGSYVVSQSPAAGTLALRGSAVNITIEPVGRPF